MADNVMTYRLTVKEVAQEFGIYATFMPKPIAGVNGSGMHTHQSLFEGDRNAFFDATDEYHLSKTAKAYIAGLLRHAPEITLRHEPVGELLQAAGARATRRRCTSAGRGATAARWCACRSTSRARRSATRIEYRSPDPACNPYLAFAAMLAAGLAGIEGDYELPPEASNNIYEMSEDEREAAGIRSLPEDLRGGDPPRRATPRCCATRSATTSTST